MVMRGVMVLALAGFLWVAQALLAYSLYIALVPSVGLPFAALAAGAASLVLMGLVILLWPRRSAAQPSAMSPDLAGIAKIAEERPLLGIALSALIGAGKAIEQGRSRQ